MTIQVDSKPTPPKPATIFSIVSENSTCLGAYYKHHRTRKKQEVISRVPTKLYPAPGPKTKDTFTCLATPMEKPVLPTCKEDKPRNKI